MKKKVKLLRVSEELHERVTELKNNLSYTEFVAQLIQMYEAMQARPQKYFSEGKFFDDLAEARGNAIIEAVKNKSIPTLPTIYICIGEYDALLK